MAIDLIRTYRGSLVTVSFDPDGVIDIKVPYILNGKDFDAAEFSTLVQELQQIKEIALGTAAYEEQVNKFLKNRQKLEAVKYVKHLTGMSLLECKSAVDKLEEELKSQADA